MRGSLLILLSLVLALGLHAKQPQGNFVHVEGTDLVKPDGQKLYIQGTNWVIGSTPRVICSD